MLPLCLSLFVCVELGLTQVAVDDVAVAVHDVHPVYDRERAWLL